MNEFKNENIDIQDTTSTTDNTNATEIEVDNNNNSKPSKLKKFAKFWKILSILSTILCCLSFLAVLGSMVYYVILIVIALFTLFLIFMNENFRNLFDAGEKITEYAVIIYHLTPHFSVSSILCSILSLICYNIADKNVEKHKKHSKGLLIFNIILATLVLAIYIFIKIRGIKQ